MSFDPAALTVAIIALFTTLAIAVTGWRRDDAAREASTRAEVVQHLLSLIESQGLERINAGGVDPLAQATAYRARAIAAARSSRKGPELFELIEVVSLAATKLGLMVVEYRDQSSKDGVGVFDREATKFALENAPRRFFTDIDLWQSGDTTIQNFDSFEMAYASSLLMFFKAERADESLHLHTSSLAPPTELAACPLGAPPPTLPV